MTAPLITMVGSLNLDINVRVPRFPGRGETLLGSDLEETPGGKSSNQAAAAAKLGGNVRLVGAVGDDFAGRTLRESADALGVDTRQVRELVGVPTGRALIQVDTAGENVITVIPGANGRIKPRDITESALAGSSIVSLALEISIDAVLQAARHAKKINAKTILNLSPFQCVPEELMALTEVLLLNEHEATQFMDWDSAPESDPGALSEKLAMLGVGAAVVTLGASGAMVMRATRATAGVATERVPGFPVKSVDTTGCGDAFAGALAQQLAMGATLTAAVQIANAAGAFADEHRGAQSSYAREGELSQWIANRRADATGARHNDSLNTPNAPPT